MFVSGQPPLPKKKNFDPFLSVLVLVILFVLVERFSVSCVQDFSKILKDEVESLKGSVIVNNN